MNNKNYEKDKATKQSGAIAYRLTPRYDLQGEATGKNPLMGVSVVASTPVTTKDMAERISPGTQEQPLLRSRAGLLQAVSERGVKREL